MKNFRFYKEEDGRWYLDYPEFEKEYGKSALEMVVGADTLLDIIAQGEESVNVSFSEEKFDEYQYLLTKSRESEDEFGGAFYDVQAFNITSFELWLCGVTFLIFGYYPEKLYLR
jgi:hypothetical protein